LSVVLRVWFSLLWLKEVVALACCGVAAIPIAGRLAAAAMLALAAKDLRRDVTRSIGVMFFHRFRLQFGLAREANHWFGRDLIRRDTQMSPSPDAR